ncbi:MAG: FAD-dependent oxidoreductase [Candidatus Methanoperedens sp.]|nr:FAD-dependent oxidoreductase [Candidatus Methanoperedens sp.]
MKENVVILGAGIAGLSAGYRLSEASIPLTIIEKESIIGGMSSCFKYKDYTLDYGPHKIFTRMDDIMEKIRNLIGKDLLTVPKKSRIRLSGKYYNFPVGVKELLTGMPFTGLSCGMGYMLAAMKAMIIKSNDDSYEEYIINRFGKGTFNLVFKPYAEKIWGHPGELSASLAKSRVAIPSIAELVIRMVSGNSNKPAISADVFYYPKNGVIEISEKLAEKIEAKNKSILNKTVPVQIDTQSNMVTVRNETGQTSVKYSSIISTIPIDELINLLKPKAPDTVILASKSLKHRNLVLIYMVIKQPRLFEDSFIFYPEEKYIFNRLSEQKGFSEFMISGNKTVLCVEITCAENDEKWNASDEVLFKKAIEGLKDVEIIGPDTEIEEYFVKRLTNAYPVYAINYQQNLEVILDFLDSLGNIYVVGRQGIFNYCGMADAMDMGFTAAEQIISEGNGFAWKDRRKKFENYVTVD